LEEKKIPINPLSAVVELELLGNRIEAAELMNVGLDILNRNDLDRIRNTIKSSYTQTR
jgi:hypothetical protein